jgi:hypothetical protein
MGEFFANVIRFQFGDMLRCGAAMRHEFEMDAAFVDPAPAWAMSCVWLSGIILNFLFWWNVINLAFTF